ncbi:MAG: methyltransferase domain-containing protein [Oscillospiraceae bacterium]|nr:methyltransferase domain-containing protein [Oscillospiraceae bacterium]
MKQDDSREQKIRSVNACKESFTAAEPQGKGKMMKRIGQKMTDWYVRPFGQAQNDFNAAAADALATLHQQLLVQQAALEETQHRLNETIREQRESFARNQHLWQAALADTETYLDRALCAADPASRPVAGVPPMTQLAGLSKDDLFMQLQAVKNAGDTVALRDALAQLKTQYDDKLLQALTACDEAPQNRPLVILCPDLQSADKAVAGEAQRLYALLKNASRYPVRLISLCKEGTAVQSLGDCSTVPEPLLPQMIKACKPALVILCDTTTAIANAGKGCLLMQNLLLRLVGQKPFEGLGGSLMQDLLHLCDYDLHCCCVDSDMAADGMQQLGFRRPFVIGEDRGFVALAEQRAANDLPYGLIHLSEWDRQLKAENQHLIKGHSALRAYFERQADAKAVSPDALPYPQNCYVLMQQQSITGLLQYFLRGKGSVTICDLSPEQSGIAPLLAPFGDCTAAPTDVLYDKIKGHYDVITLFDLLHHFAYSDRRKLWASLHSALAQDGMLLLNVPNLRFALPRRLQKGWGQYPLYDVCFTKETFYRELKENGFAPQAMLPVGQGLYSVAGVSRNEPISWTAMITAAP